VRKVGSIDKSRAKRLEELRAGGGSFALACSRAEALAGGGVDIFTNTIKGGVEGGKRNSKTRSRGEKD